MLLCGEKVMSRNVNSKVKSATKEVDIEMTCPICQKCVSTIESYIQHLVGHIPKDSKEKFKYLCNQCTYSSTVRDHLRKHLMRHYDIKPFSCDHCSWSCVTRFQMQRHIQNHHLNLRTPDHYFKYY